LRVHDHVVPVELAPVPWTLPRVRLGSGTYAVRRPTLIRTTPARREREAGPDSEEDLPTRRHCA